MVYSDRCEWILYAIITYYYYCIHFKGHPVGMHKCLASRNVCFHSESLLLHLIPIHKLYVGTAVPNKQSYYVLYL